MTPAPRAQQWIFLMFFASACAKSATDSGGNSNNGRVCQVTSIAVVPASDARVDVGATLPLAATVTQTGCTTVDLVWESSAPAIATVSVAGVVRGIAPGTATISASAGGQRGQSVVRVDPVIASLVVTGAPSSPLAFADTIRLGSVARDGAGNVVASATPTWSSSDATVATVSSAGLVTAVKPGLTTITATVGSIRATANITAVLTFAERRFGFATVEGTAAIGAGGSTNATGGTVSASRTGPGEYVVTFERMARVDSAFQEVALLSILDGQASVCRNGEPRNASNARDLEVAVVCYDASGGKRDQRFSLLVIGSRSLPGRLSFTTTQELGATHTPPRSATYNSNQRPVLAEFLATGIWKVSVDNARTSAAENYFISTLGTNVPGCWIQAWEQGAYAGVQCWGQTIRVDARFSIVMLDSGRPGKKFGLAWVGPGLVPPGEQPVEANYWGSTSGVEPKYERLGAGQYRVRFPGVPLTAGVPRIPHLSQYGPTNTTCRIVATGNSANGADYVLTVSCYNRFTGAAADGEFTMLFLE